MIKKKIVNKHFWWKLLLIVIGYLGVMLGIFFYALNRVKIDAKTASADTITTTPYYLTYGTTNVDGEITSGCPEQFTVYMHSRTATGVHDTVYNNHQSNWSQYNFIVKVHDIKEHVFLELYKGGALYKSVDVSGDSDLTVNFGALPSGNYTFKYQCRYKKNLLSANVYYTYEYKFEVDVTDPTYTITDTTGTSIYCVNKAITYTASDHNFSYIGYRCESESKFTKYYGNSITIPATEANNAYWYFFAVDTLGNQVDTVIRKLDTISPVGAIKTKSGNAVADGGATNEPFYYEPIDASGIASMQYKKKGSSDWNTYTSDTLISGENATYVFRAVDIASNLSDEYEVTYDSVRPTGIIYDAAGTQRSGAITNKTYVKYVASDTASGVAMVYVQKPGSSSFVQYTNGDILTAEGKYRFKAVDISGNETSSIQEITLDLTAPTGQLKANGANVANGSYTSQAFNYTASDAVGVAICQYKKPNGSTWTTYTQGTNITGTEGWYYFRTTDLAGNVSAESKIFYDVSTPDVYLVKADIGMNGEAQESGAIVNSECIRVTATDTGSGIKAMYMSRNSGAYSAYAEGTELTAEGEYSFYAVDNAGLRSTTYYIMLDKTAPTGFIYCDDTLWNGILNTTGADCIRFDATDVLAGVEKCYVKMPNSKEFEECNSNIEFSDEGKYEFYAVDTAGNSSTIYSIIVNHTAPVGNLYINGKLATDNNGYTNGEYISYIFNTGSGFIMVNDNSISGYTSGMTYSEEGRYSIWVEDVGGQAGCAVVIDRTAKELTLTGVVDGLAEGEVQISWTDGDARVDAPVEMITVNGQLYTGGTIYTMNNVVYEIVCTDKAGNVWTTEFMGYQKNIPTTTLQKLYWEVQVMDSDAYSSFQNYENALEYAMFIEQKYVETKTWATETWDQGVAMDTKDSANAANGTYYLYKSEESPEKVVAYFTQERLNEVIKVYAEQLIKEWYYWEKAPAPCADGDLHAYPEDNKIIATQVELREGLIYTLDGMVHAEHIINEPGLHTLLIEDGYGNSIEYEIYILDKAQSIEYALGDNSPSQAEYDRTYNFNGKVTISISFEGDELAMFALYGKGGKLLGYYDIENSCVITESGTYTAVAYNHYGASEEFSFVVSMKAPEISSTENDENKYLEIKVTESTDKSASITFLEISKSIDNGNTWVVLKEDDYGKAITIETLQYKFRTDGMYKVVVMDEFRTGVDALTYIVEYTQPAPIGKLEGVENGGVTNTAVVFNWEDEVIVTLLKDGVAMEYRSGQKLTEDGVYILSFEDFNGYRETYTFTIDTIAPEIKTEGAEHREAVNEDVKVFYTEENLTAELYKDGKSLGAYASGNPISADGHYRVRVYDLAGNEVSVEFSIDKTVEYDINVYDKGLSNSVVVISQEVLTTELLKNGEKKDYALGSAITEIGDYTLVLTDTLGNKDAINFRIINPLVKEFTHNFDDIEGMGGVLVNGEDKRLNYGTLELFEDGKYEVGVIVGGITYKFTVTVDATAPTIVLNGVENNGSTKEGVSITELSTDAIIKVYLNGEELAYTLGETLATPGSYKVILEDTCGNISEYAFEIQKTLSGGVIALIVIGSVAIAGAIVFLVLKKKKVF